jgi:predicted PurR-regulated permease PerM
MTDPEVQIGHRRFIERALIILVIVAVALLLWRLRSLLMLVFGAVLVAVIFSLVANPIRRWLRLPDGIALVCAVLIVAGIFGIAFWMFGAEVARQSSVLQ